MACIRCGAPTPKRLCQTHRIERAHEGTEAEDLGWNRAKEIEEREAGERED